MTDRDVTRTCVYSFSGGTASLAADLVGSAGLKLATFEPQTLAALTARAPAFGFVDNPVDLTTKVFTDGDLNRAVFELICDDPNVGSVLFAMPADYEEDTVAVSRDAVEIARSTGTLLIPVWMSPRRGGGYQVLHAAGLTPLDGVYRAVKALRRFAEWRAQRRRRRRDGRPRAGTGGAAPGGGQQRSEALTYDQSKELLSAVGVRTPLESFVTSADEAAEAADLDRGAGRDEAERTRPDPQDGGRRGAARHPRRRAGGGRVRGDDLARAAGPLRGRGRRRLRSGDARRGP